MAVLRSRATIAVMTKVLIVGGGVAALEAALALRELASELAQVELVAPDIYFVYRPLLVTGEARSFPLERLAEDAGTSLRNGIVTGVDPERHAVQTSVGEELAFDLLLLALGAAPTVALPGALCFRGPGDAAELARMRDQALAGAVGSFVFAVPTGARWALPLYELALLTRAQLVDAGAIGVRVTVVTPEDSPLELFGSTASSAIAELLEDRGIELVLGTTPLAFAEGALAVAPGGSIQADRAVALPRLEGPRLQGLSGDAQGFLPTDAFGQVSGEYDIWAAGDATSFPLKQGGIASQQADAAAESIAARAGAKLEPSPFRPVLRGLLLTGMSPRFLRAEGSPAASAVDTEPLWWPPAKIVGRYLAPFLARHLGLSELLPDAARESAIPVEIELDPASHGVWSNV
jgi:sulfide:quinone oxidoreductase